LLEEAAGVETMGPGVTYVHSIRAAVRSQYGCLLTRLDEILRDYAQPFDKMAEEKYGHLLAFEKILQEQSQTLFNTEAPPTVLLQRFRRELLHLNIMQPQRSPATVNRIQKHFGLDFARRSPETRNRIEKYFRR